MSYLLHILAVLLCGPHLARKRWHPVRIQFHAAGRSTTYTLKGDHHASQTRFD